MKETSRSHAWISWDAPLIDGGSPVKSYVVEKRLAERKAWTCVAAETPKTSFRILNLEAGQAYCFRVLAENAYGIGEGCETAGSVRASGTSRSFVWFPVSVEVFFFSSTQTHSLFLSFQSNQAQSQTLKLTRPPRSPSPWAGRSQSVMGEATLLPTSWS